MTTDLERGEDQLVSPLSRRWTEESGSVSPYTEKRWGWEDHPDITVSNVSNECFPFVPPETLKLGRSKKGSENFVSSIDNLELYVGFTFDDGFVPQMEMVNIHGLPAIHMNNQEYSASEVLQTLNYGDTATLELSSASGWTLHAYMKFGEENRPCCIWNESLVKDFVESIFDKRTSWLLHGHDRFGIFDHPEQEITAHKDFYGWLESQNLQLLRESLGQLSRCCKRACVNWKCIIPHSYLVIELIRLVKFLTESMKEDIIDADEDSFGFERFLDESAEFWKDTFRNSITNLLSPLIAQ
jgi:hypothetical protein